VGGIDFSQPLDKGSTRFEFTPTVGATIKITGQTIEVDEANFGNANGSDITLINGARLVTFRDHKSVFSGISTNYGSITLASTSDYAGLLTSLYLDGGLYNDYTGEINTSQKGALILQGSLVNAGSILGGINAKGDAVNVGTWSGNISTTGKFYNGNGN